MSQTVNVEHKQESKENPMILDSKVPDGPIDKKWEQHKFNLKLVNPANKRKYNVKNF